MALYEPARSSETWLAEVGSETTTHESQKKSTKDGSGACIMFRASGYKDLWSGDCRQVLIQKPMALNPNRLGSTPLSGFLHY